MKWVLHFILSHSIFIAFCAAALSLQTFHLLSLPVNGYLLAFIFFATLGGYNAYWIVSRLSYNATAITLLSFVNKNKRSIAVLLLAIAGMLICVTRLQLVAYNIIGTFILLVLYAIPVTPVKQFHFTRKIGFLKTTLLAFTWAVVTTLIPLQIPVPDMGESAILLFIARFLFMLILCIIFDKRDIAIDKIRGLQSLATNTAPTLLHYLVGIILICYLFICYRLTTVDIKQTIAVALAVSGIIALIVYCCSLNKRGYLFYYFLVDGLMFLSGLLTELADWYGK